MIFKSRKNLNPHTLRIPFGIRELTFLLLFGFLNSCIAQKQQVSVIVLGTVQDAGSPHIGCKKECCSALFLNPDENRKVVALGFIDIENDKTFLFEATPDMPSQVKLNNITIQELANARQVKLTSNLTVVPFLVPHRDEYSETVGYKILGPNKSLLFIPDIDKWSKWKKDIIKEVKNVDYAFLDATFFDGAEINNRDISEIPHPFIIESMELFKQLPESEKAKIYFIHFNHTNPALQTNSKKANAILNKGFKIAKFGQTIGL